MRALNLLLCTFFGSACFACDPSASNSRADIEAAAGATSETGVGAAGQGSASEAGAGGDPVSQTMPAEAAGAGSADALGSGGNAPSGMASGGTGGDRAADMSFGGQPASGAGGAGMGGTGTGGAGTGGAGAGAGGVGEAGSGSGSATDPDPSGVTSIVASPLALTPSFSTAVTDYYVRCAAGENALTLTTTRGEATTVEQLTVTPGQAVTVDDRYWVRCLPPDFPVLTVTRPGTPTPGYYLLNASKYGLVLDTNGVPVWYTQGSAVLNVESPAPNTLSLMPNYAAPVANDSIFPFQILSLDTNVAINVGSPNGQTDVHELRTAPNGNRLLFTAPLTSGVNLTGLKSFGDNATILDCEIEELSPSGELVWSWLASEHIDPARESLEPALVTQPSTFVDVFHCNSIEPDETGNLLLSVRHANALFYIERSTGKIKWKLGGTEYNQDGAALISVHGDSQGTFSMQHDARFQPNGNVSMFDNHGAGTGVARGIEYAIDHHAGVATPVFQFLGTGPSQFQGSFRRSADGESVIGWGRVPGDPRSLTEIDANGQEVFNVGLGAGNVSYRAVKVPLTQLDIQLLRSSAGK